MSRHTITPVQRGILNVLEGLEPMERHELAAAVDMEALGAFTRHLATLRNDGLIWYPRSGCVALTDTARAWLQAQGRVTD